MKRILLIRADRMGDVVLTTPVFKAIKEQFPGVHLALLVVKENQDLVQDHPFLDEVISYDKQGSDGNHIFGFLKFVWKIRAKKFDVAFHLHPRARFNWISFLAGIPVRIGYRVKNHYLLTKAFAYDKPQGKKHEAAYNFDFLNLIDVHCPEKIEPLIICHKKCEHTLDPFLDVSKPYAVFNPSASSPSKMWPVEFFSDTANQLADRYGWTTVIIGGPKDVEVGKAMEKAVKHKVINLTGKLPLGALPWLFVKSSLVLSNDTGPAHVAAAVGARTISLFLRNEAGLGADRWRPLGPRCCYLSKPSDVHQLLPAVVLQKVEWLMNDPETVNR